MMLWNILALFFMLRLRLCPDLKVESIPNEIHITFIYHNRRGNEYEVGRNRCTPFPRDTSPLDKLIAPLF